MIQSYPGPGSLLADRYRVVRRIGEGGMGVVLEAQNTLTEKRVALKWLHASVAKNPEACQRMMREATASCRVRHPNVVDVYDVFQHGESIFLVMELLDGEPLRDLLDRGGVPLHELIALLLPAMHGVAEAHRQGVVHRDIHPGNIFLARQPGVASPVPVVLDFGISKVLSDQAKQLTRSGMTMGTPLYMSYEQMCSTRDVDGRTDVYSFGVIVYEALTGQLPFDGETFAEIAIKLATGAPVPPRELRPALPVALERVILHAMARQRDDRIASLDALIRELTPFASAAGFSEPAVPEVLALLPTERASLPLGTPSEALSSTMAGLAPNVNFDTLGNVRSPLAQTIAHASKPPSDRSARLRMMAAGACVALALLGFVGWALLGRGTPDAEAAAVESEPRALPEYASPSPLPGASSRQPAAIPHVDPAPSAVLSPDAAIDDAAHALALPPDSSPAPAPAPRPLVKPRPPGPVRPNPAEPTPPNARTTTVTPVENPPIRAGHMNRGQF